MSTTTDAPSTGRPSRPGSVAIGPRIVPPVVFDVRRPHRMLERSMMVTRRNWGIIVTGFFEPLFYLLSIRVGLSALIGDVETGGRLVPYDQFVAPALMAASAMNGAVFDSTMNIFFKLKHSKTYDAVLATPMSAGDVAVGEVGWAVVRGALYSTFFMFAIIALGMAHSPWIVLSVPACVLIGFAFASVGMALTTYMRSWEDFEYIPSITLPLFLFSATFYPLSQYGDWAWLVQLSPLYHGVELVRAANFGVWDPSIIGHISVLVGMTVVGMAVASRRIERLLLT